MEANQIEAAAPHAMPEQESTTEDGRGSRPRWRSGSTDLRLMGEVLRGLGPLLEMPDLSSAFREIGAAFQPPTQAGVMAALFARIQDASNISEDPSADAEMEAARDALAEAVKEADAELRACGIEPPQTLHAWQVLGVKAGMEWHEAGQHSPREICELALAVKQRHLFATSGDPSPKAKELTVDVLTLPKLGPHDRQAWMLHVAGRTQSEIAEILNSQFGRRLSQPRVSEMLARARLHAEASGLAAALQADAPKRRAFSLDPGRLELGARTDRRTPRSRHRDD